MRSTYSDGHVIGFPNGDQQINTQEDPTSNHIYGKSNSPYGPLYQLSNMCLEDGYSVLYGAESIPDKSAAERLLEDIKNVNTTQEVLNIYQKAISL